MNYSENKNAAGILRALSVGICSVALFYMMPTPARAQSALTHHMRPAVVNGQAQYLNHMPAGEFLRLHLMLPVRNQAGLDKFLTDVHDPASPSYRHFLTVSEFTEQFGPTEEDYNALTRYAASNGLKIVGGSRDGMDLQVEGSVAVIEAALHVSMGIYQHPTENRAFYAPDREPTVGLPFPLWHVSGLDSFSTPHPAIVRNSERPPARGPVTTQPSAITGSGPSASYLGSDMRAAYYGGTALTGTGQNLGLLEFYGTDLADVTTYFKNIGQTNNVPINLLSTDGTSTSCINSAGCSDLEQTIDITQALGMAPGLASLDLYVGTIDGAIISAMTTHSPLPTTISSSWIWSPSDITALDPYFQRMAAQGQNFFVAAGDKSTWSSSNPAWPADDAYVISVGGTTLTTSGAGGGWKSETAWTDGGGGISPNDVAIPSWQKLPGVITPVNRGSGIYRNGPDVSANAGASYYVCANQVGCTANEFGGTSFAAPLWAAYMALVNQQAVANGNTTFGFMNPVLYSYGVSSAYASDFHDITSGTSGSFSATPGYDLVTGWGSPNGTGLITALAAIPTTPNFSLSASSASVSLAQGGTGTATLTTAISGGFKSAIVLSASGEPSGVTLTFGPASVAAPGAGTSTLTVTAAANAAPGDYIVTITGTGAGITHTSTISLLVTLPAFSLTASPASVSLAPGARSSGTIMTTVSGGFNSAVALTASGLPTGVTATFSPASIAAPGLGTSTVTFTAASTAVAGNYTVVVTATGGGVTRTSNLNLTVSMPASFAISVSPAAVSITPGSRTSSASATITATLSASFDSTITVTVSGLPAGASAAFGPASTPAPDAISDTMALSAAASSKPGTYPVTITATGGGISHTAALSLTVN